MIRSLPKSQSHAGPWRAGSLCRVVQSTRLALLIALASAAPAAPLAAQCADGSPPPCARPATRSGPPAANSVAILFFDARDTADAYLAEGLTEDLTSLLGSVARVQVKSPGVVRRAQRASPGDAPAIARALGVRYLVDGNVRRVGTRIRVSTRLVNGATAVAAWGDVFDRTPDELLALPSLIAREVALHVGGPAPSSEAGVLGTLRTRSPAAYDHYLRGNFFLALRSPEGTARAVAEYREAERLDSGFAAAIGRAAYAYAIALEPASPLARWWRSLARLVAGDVRGAQDDAELANRLQPGDIVVENVLALVLARAGDSTRARALIAHWPGRTDHWVVMAALLAVGDTAATLDRFERAGPNPAYWTRLHRPEFNALHGNPRYERLLAAVRPAGAVGP